MPNRYIDRDCYECMIDAFRKHKDIDSGSIAAVRIDVLRDPRSGGRLSLPTLKRAFHEGWPNRGWEPIKDILYRERQQATEIVNSVTHDEDRRILGTDNPLEHDSIDHREKTRQDAIIARAAEAKLVRESRASLIELLSSSRELLHGYTHLSKEVNKFLQNATVESMEDARKASNLLWRIAITTSTATSSGLKVLQMERLLLGQPMEIIGTKDVEEISDEDALTELEEAAKVAERIRKRREKEFHLSGILSGNLDKHGLSKKSNGKSNGHKGNGVDS